MKSKRSRKQLNSPGLSRALIIAASTLAVIVGVFFVFRYISQLQYEQTILKEDVIFARMETFVNLAKIRLDQELPEGSWEINKYCEKPGSKGTIDTYNYRCAYTATTTEGVQDSEKLKVLGSVITSDTSVSLSPSYERDHPGFSFYASDATGLSGLCSFTSSVQDGRYYASVSCSTTCYALHYPLK